MLKIEQHEPHNSRGCKVLRKGRYFLLKKQQTYSYEGPLLREDAMTIVLRV